MSALQTASYGPTSARPRVIHPPKEAKRPLMKFRLLHGSHCFLEGETPGGDPIIKQYHAIKDNFPIIETDLDLAAIYNARDEDGKPTGHTPKFEKLYPGDGSPASIQLPPNAQIFDPDVESIEQFSARMRAMSELTAQGAITNPVDQAVRQGFDPRQSNTAPTSPPLTPNQASIPGAVPKTVQAGLNDTFDHMTLEELKQYAATEEIQLGKAKTKDEVLKIVKADAGLR